MKHAILDENNTVRNIAIYDAKQSNKTEIYIEDGVDCRIGDVYISKTNSFETPIESQDQELILKLIRDAKIVGGIEVNGLAVDSDETTQARITGLVVKADKDSSFTVNWSTANGKVTLDASTIIALGDAMVSHVQKCFDAYFNVTASDAKTTQELSDIFDSEYNKL